MAAFLLNEPFFWHTLGQAGALVLTFSVALVLMAFHWGWGTQVLARRCRVLRSFGVRSYEIYLTHMFVVFPVVGLFRLSGARLYRGWPCFLVTLGLSWVLGACVARTFSLPVERWLRRGEAIWTMQARHRI